MEALLMEWEVFARKYWKGPHPDSATLRNDAQIMLEAVVEDMATHQSEDERRLKSHGAFRDRESRLKHAALRHALARVNDGFDIEKMVAEFRALRASVNRLWWQSVPSPHPEQIEDMARFNEALDELVALSLAAFTDRVDRSRRLFLGILGHDLRQPLHSLKMFIEVLGHVHGMPAAAAPIVSKIGKCCDGMAAMLTDLLDFTTTDLGAAMPVHPVHTGMEEICQEVLTEVRAGAPGRTFLLECSGNLEGEWDSCRLRQLLSNFLANAVRYGASDKPIKVTLRGTDGEVALAVHNEGPPIPEESLGILFDPMVRLGTRQDRPSGSIGLGLYICRQIALAHGGKIAVESSAENGTTFTVRLPKHYVEHPAEMS
jgi:signal transduction histidine kinase